MKAKLVVRTDNNNIDTISESTLFIDKVIDIISNMDCHSFFHKLIGKKQAVQKIMINNFQKELLFALNSNMNTTGVNWQEEIKADSNCGDTFDLFSNIVLDNHQFKIIIELDKNRADQISKKFLSRISLSINSPTIYFAFCYPGTKNMSINESKKYFGYCSTIITLMNSNTLPKIFVGMITEN
ncbi:MAG: hypothetical protein HXX13_13660 [Bacteroidetes bacterium]|nr:hypothetical protein [Bacteroidota bacterium]